MTTCPPTCTRHAALGHQDGPCGPLTLADIQAVAAAAEEARGRADAATPGPWSLDGRGAEIAVIEYGEQGERSEDDAAFIAAARSDVPALARAIEALCADLLRLRRAAEAVDHAYEAADHAPPCIVALGRVLAGREP